MLGARTSRAEGEAEITREGAMATGTLKLWNIERGFGFIQDDAKGPDIFVHAIALRAAGINPDTIVVGTRLIYEVEPTRDSRTRACDIRLAELGLKAKGKP